MNGFSETIAQIISSPEVAAALPAWSAATAEPQSVIAQLQLYSERHRENPTAMATLSQGLSSLVWAKRLVTVLGNSPFLSRILLRWPHFLQELMDSAIVSSPMTRRPELLTAMTATPRPSREQALQILRHFKHREFFRIGLLDLNGEAPLLEVTGALSEIAEICLEGGYRWIDRELSHRHGQPMADHQGAWQRTRFVILGMGKFGARELNFSSDIDLIFLYSADQGQTDGTASLPIKSYYIRLGQELMKLLHESTGDGMVFRVDLRLRPDGESGDLALSCRSAEIYYESWGQTWERSAMIKARAVAGDLELGESFLHRLQPFIYRRYLDFGALEALREMKRKIDRKITRVDAEEYHRNIKLGRGGIREIEFFVQCQQLIHGGKEPSLRLRETIPTLRQLHHLGFIDGQSATFLENSYLFLRTVEHRLQIVQERQTHSLPEDAEEFERLSKRLALKSSAELHDQLARVTQGVHGIYENLFFETDRGTLTVDQRVEQLLALPHDGEAALTTMVQVGFQKPAAAQNLLRILQEGPRELSLTETSRRWFDRLAPRLLQEILAAPDQDMALQHAESFLLRLGRRAHYLALLVESPAILHLLVRLFGSSGLLSRFLIHHPELLDSLIAPGFLDRYRSRGELSVDLARHIAEADGDAETEMHRLRDFKNAETLRIGLRDLSGMSDLTEVMAGLSTLADVILHQVKESALRGLTPRPPSLPHVDKREKPPQPQFAILALGKLGGGELNYSSDLDLIFVYDVAPEEENEGKDGPPNDGPFFLRLGQKIITSITTLTRAGKLYELDMRLRPSGNSGPLVISFSAFSHYQRHEAWTWEHQALTRARVVTGDARLSERLKGEIQAILSLRRNLEQLRQEVAHMRERMFAEKHPPEGVIDIKQSRGGIVDVEFLTQFLILAHAADHPAVARRNVVNALLACRRENLLSVEEAAGLINAYQYYRFVENRLRLLHDRSENRIRTDRLDTVRLERLCGLTENENVIDLLMGHFAIVVPIYQRFLP